MPIGSAPIASTPIAASGISEGVPAIEMVATVSVHGLTASVFTIDVSVDTSLRIIASAAAGGISANVRAVEISARVGLQ
jgi:hypothetical protein